MRLTVAAVLLVLTSGSALAHSWYQNRTDPLWKNSCCGGNDCAQLVVTPENVTAEADGYRIRLSHEEAKKINPYTTDGIDALVIWERVQPSEDGNWHICIMTSYRDKARGGIYCLFAPPNG